MRLSIVKNNNAMKYSAITGMIVLLISFCMPTCAYAEQNRSEISAFEKIASIEAPANAEDNERKNDSFVSYLQSMENMFNAIKRGLAAKSNAVPVSDAAALQTATNAAQETIDYSWVDDSVLLELDNDGRIELLGEMAQADSNKSGILPSITIAQAILESGWCESKLAGYNNLFGMKSEISGNTWENSTWSGNIIDMTTGEEYNGVSISIIAGFRTYENCWLSIKDHSAYLAGAKNGSSLRYDGIVGCTDARRGIEIIKAGGYATSSSYVDSVMNIIERYDLTRFDVIE